MVNTNPNGVIEKLDDAFLKVARSFDFFSSHSSRLFMDSLVVR